jgi:RNA polymerase sigma-70 factor (ECF subfamily)
MSMSGGGDPWMAWLKEHGAALMLLARQWASTQADAEDVVQEAFVRFWRSRERVAEPVAYLYASVKHCALDAHKRRQRRLGREAATARPEAEPLFAGPLEESERQAAIEAALRELPSEQAEVLVMRIWGELSFPQIAAALDAPVNTVSSRYRYALAKLREVLAEEPIR